MKKYFVLITMVLTIFPFQSDAQILRNIGRKVQDNLARAVEDMVVEKVSNALVNAAMRPIEKSFDDMLRAAFEADSIYYSTDPAYRDSLRFRSFEAYMSGLNAMADVPDEYVFDNSITYLIEYEKEKNNYKIHFSKDAKKIAMEQISQKEQGGIVVMDFERDINVIYSEDKNGEKYAQAVPSMLKLAASYAKAKNTEENENFTLTKTGKSKNILGYTCEGYLAVTDENETEYFQAPDFPISFGEAFLNAVSNFAPMSAKKEYSQLTGMVLESSSKEKKTGKTTFMKVTEFTEKPWVIKNSEYKFGADE